MYGTGILGQLRRHVALTLKPLEHADEVLHRVAVLVSARC